MADPWHGDCGKERDGQKIGYEDHPAERTVASQTMECGFESQPPRVQRKYGMPIEAWEAKNGKKPVYASRVHAEDEHYD